MADQEAKFDARSEIAGIGAIGDFEKRPQIVDEQNPDRPYMSPRDAVQEMLAEEKAKKKNAMLSWGDRSEYRTPEGKEVPLYDRQQGRYDGRLPGVGPIYGYWWQNDRIFYGKVREVSIDQVPEKVILRKKVERNEKAVEEEVYPRRTLLKCIEAQQKARVNQDPWTCRVCKRYRASGQLDFSAHLYREHPAEFAEFVEALDSQPPEATPPPPPAAAPSKKKPVLAPSA